MKNKFLKWSLILTCLVVFWLGFLNNQQTTGIPDNARLIHTIDRLSFGLAPGDLEKVKNIGLENYLQSQLNPQKTKETSILKNNLAKLDMIHKDSIELFKKYKRYNASLKKPNSAGLTTEKKRKLLRERGKLKQNTIRQVQDAHLIRALLSPNQLQEVMVDFWFNHFNVFIRKNTIAFWLSDYEEEIRENALGNFRDLLAITAHHPAMLLYLDNNLNVNPSAAAARGRKKGLNENYARELMELHTLGVNGGYTQDDVVALARIFTGWGIDYSGKHGNENNFQFYEKLHDSQDKTFLGHLIKGGGIEEGEQALDILAAHPATAKFISYKLAQYFVADQPPETLVDKLQDKFINSQGNIKEVLTLLFHSDEFNSTEYYEQKFKTPYQYILSLVRLSGINSPNLQRIKNMLTQLSMPIYGCLTPDGYKNTQQAWLNPDAMLRRISFATAISNGALNKKRRAINAPKLQSSLGDSLSSTTKDAISNSPPNLRAALILGSPEMMKK